MAVVGGGYGGATAARYIRMLDAAIEVVLVEPERGVRVVPAFQHGAGRFRGMADITVPYAGLERHGVRVVRDTRTAIDMDTRQVRLARGDADRASTT